MPKGGRSHGSKSRPSGKSNFGKHTSHNHHHHHFGHNSFGHRSHGHSSIGHNSFNRRRNHRNNTYGSFYSGPSAIDIISSTVSVPTISNGMYKHSGNQVSIMTQLQKFDSTVYQCQQKAFNESTQFIEVTQINLTIVGNLASVGNQMCRQLTCMAGIICIIPLFFMCCNWWKKIVIPLYEMNTQTYNSIGRFMINHPNIKTLSLQIVDNNFNAEKSRIIYSFMATITHLTAFNFQNIAEPLDYIQNQYDCFVQNMTPIKSLPITLYCGWDDHFLI